MKIGIDIGWTLKGVRLENDKNMLAPNSLETIHKLLARGDTIYLISKVNSKQKEHVEQWLADNDFFKKSGIHPDNLYFCFERKDKALFVKALGIEVMIDDRAEVMVFLDNSVKKFLLTPENPDYEKYWENLVNTDVVFDWYEIERKLF